MSEGDFLSDIGGAVRRRAAAVRKRVVPHKTRLTSKRQVGKTDRAVNLAAAAHIQAAANVGAVEQMRPNAYYSLITSTPATAIAAATATGPLKVQIAGDTYISSFKATQGDEADFLITQLAINGFDIIKTSAGVNLAAFIADANRVDSPIPLVGRRFTDGVGIEANFLNTNSAAKVWHGLAVATISGECIPNAKKTSLAPFLFNAGHIAHSLRGMFSKRS